MPGVYEGGLKVWECSEDLLDYLDEISEMPDKEDDEDGDKKGEEVEKAEGKEPLLDLKVREYLFPIEGERFIEATGHL